MRLIDADELMQKVVPKNEDAEFRCVPLSDIINAPTVYPEPQKIGKWIIYPLYPDGGEVYMCSECGKFGMPPYFNYCPNCGAQMEGADDRYD